MAECNIKPWHWCIARTRSPVCCKPRVIVCCFYTGATRKGGIIWTQRPTRTYGKSLSVRLLIVTIQRQINLLRSDVHFLIFLNEVVPRFGSARTAHFKRRCYEDVACVSLSPSPLWLVEVWSHLIQFSCRQALCQLNSHALDQLGYSKDH